MSKFVAALLVLLLPLSFVGCVGSKKKAEKEKAALIEKFVLEAPPASMKKLGTNFDDKITLLGYELDSDKVKPGSTVNFTLYWKVEKALGASGWKLFTHVLDSKKRRILNIDKVGPLRAESAPTPSQWQVGKIYADEQSFKVPSKAAGEQLSVTVGVWKGETRLKVLTGPSAGDNRALALKVNVTGQKEQKPNTKVPSLRVDRMPKGSVIKIDGKLDEELWKTAPSTGAFVNVGTGNPDEKSPVQGEAKLLWSEKALYVGFTVKDKDVTGGFKKTDVDPHLWTKDCVELMIDPDGDGDNKDYYEIQINPQNLVFDSRFEDYNLPRGGKDGPFGHQDWSSKVKSAVTVQGTLDKPGDEDEGYVVELEIPWTSFDKAKRSPPNVGDEWRINLYAMQNNRGVAWSPILGQGNFHKASRFGRVLWAEAGWVAPIANEKEGSSVLSSTEKAGAKGPGDETGKKQSDEKSEAKPEATVEGKLEGKTGASTKPETPKVEAPKSTAPKELPKDPAPKAPAPKPAAPAPAAP